MTAPGTAVMGSGASIRATPVERIVFENEFGLTTCFKLLLACGSPMLVAMATLSFMTRVTELVADFRSFPSARFSALIESRGGSFP